MRKLLKIKIGQVWVETVIYTLIGLTIIAVILAVATPAIERYKDELVLEQTISLLNDLDSTITNVKDSGSGNRRIVPELMIKKGKLEINGETNEINYILEKTRLEYSEPGKTIVQGNMNIATTKTSDDYYDIRVGIAYNNLNITYEGEDKNKTFTEASVPYRVGIQNQGVQDYDAGGATEKRIEIKIDEVS
jgi:type II secretory pathway pseudopilin PulG